MGQGGPASMIYWPTGPRLDIRLTPRSPDNITPTHSEPQTPTEALSKPTACWREGRREGGRGESAAVSEFVRLVLLSPLPHKPCQLVTNHGRRSTSCRYPNTHRRRKKNTAAGESLNMLMSLIYFNHISEGTEGRLSSTSQVGPSW